MEQAAKWIATAAAAVTVIVCWLRHGFGIDFSDESYYVSLAYRFVLGDVPFRDELHLSQTAALITRPFVEAFVGLTGSTEGIVLFTRRLFLIFQCGVAAAVCVALQRRLPAPAALAVSLLCVALVPFGIPNLSYNTLGSGFFTLGIFLASAAIFDGEGRLRTTLACGVAHGLAVLAYPPLLLPTLAFAGVLTLLVSSHRLRALLAYAAGGAAVGSMLVAGVDASGFVRVYEFMATTYDPAPGKLGRVVGQLWEALPSALILFGGSALLAWQRRRRPVVVVAMLPLLPLLVAWSLARLDLWQSPLAFVASLGFTAPFLLPLVQEDAGLRRLFVGAWIPSVCAGVTFAWSSSNGYLNAGLGMVPAAVVVCVYLDHALRTAVDAIGSRRLALVPLIALLVVPAILLCYQRGLYMGGQILPDGPILDLATEGPFAGIRGSRSRNDFLRVLSEDLEPLERPDGRILFYDHFPAGYLLSRMRPATPSIYSCFLLTEARDPDLCAGRLREALSAGPVVAVRLPPLFILGNRLRGDPEADAAVDRVVKRRLRPGISRIDRQQQPLYEIYSSDGSE